MKNGGSNEKTSVSLGLALVTAFSIAMPVSAAKMEVGAKIDLPISTAAKAATTWKYCASVFTCFKQEKGNSCGPACVRMALWVLNGKDYGEAAIRTGCKTTTKGTNINDMRVYINFKSATKYGTFGKSGMTQDTFKNKIYNSIVNKHAPVILLVNQTVGTWPSGVDKRANHYIVVRAISSDKTKLKIADPYQESSDYYEISTDTAYQALYQLLTAAS